MTVRLHKMKRLFAVCNSIISEGGSIIQTRYPSFDVIDMKYRDIDREQFNVNSRFEA